MKYDSKMPFTTENAAIIAKAMADGVLSEAARDMVKVMAETAVKREAPDYTHIHEIGEMQGISEGIECAVEIFTNEAKFRETIAFLNKKDTPSN